jgi:hypothetical protein
LNNINSQQENIFSISHVPMRTEQMTPYALASLTPSATDEALEKFDPSTPLAMASAISTNNVTR